METGSSTSTVPPPPQLDRDGSRVSSVPSQSSSADQHRNISGSTGYGTVTQQRFTVPQTLSMADALLKPSNWGLAEIFVNVVMLFHVCTLFLIHKLPAWFYITQFLFWRFSYNLFLGLVLHKQSHTNFITHHISSNLSHASQTLLKSLAKSSMGTAYAWRSLPPEFNAWVLFRMLAMLILANDGLTYFIMFAKLFTIPSSTADFLVLFLSSFPAAALAWFSLWSKTAAHRTVGDYAWYWGDFFFMIESDDELVFDGVFEMFPHPMYTVGYAAYYGASCFARSSTLLVVSLVAHLAQILFLVYVEEPHIQKVYGGLAREEEEEGEQENDIGASRDRERASHARESMGLKNVDLWRPTDLCMVLMIVGVVMVTIWSEFGIKFYVAQVVAWRVLHWVVISWVLHAQTTRNWWMSRMTSRGYTPREAFAMWCRLYNLSVVMNHAAFLSFAARVSIFKWKTAAAAAQLMKNTVLWWDSSVLATTASGIVLILISFYVVTTAADSLGDASWFYGDFFFPLAPNSPSHTQPQPPPSPSSSLSVLDPTKQSVKSIETSTAVKAVEATEKLKKKEQEEQSFAVMAHTEPKYVGIYRYMNNPDCVLGFLGHYGVALITRSWAVFWVALVSHVANYAFVHVVEVPHMQRRYGKNDVRDAAALEKALRKHVLERVADAPVIKSIQASEIGLRAAKSTEKLTRLSSNFVDNTAAEIAEKVEKIRAEIERDVKRLADDIRKHRVVVQSARLKNSAAEKLQNADVELLTMLRSSSLTRNYLDKYDNDHNDNDTENHHEGHGVNGGGDGDGAVAQTEPKKTK